MEPAILRAEQAKFQTGVVVMKALHGVPVEGL